MRFYRLEIEKRARPQFGSIMLWTLVAVFLSLLTGAIIMWVKGMDPFAVYGNTFFKVFGTSYGLSETVIKSVSIMIGAMAVAVAGRAGLWNIGVEGQFYVGAIAAAGVALFLNPDLPSYIMIPLMFGAGFFAGALLGFICALPRAYLNVSEIITTLFPWYMVVLWVIHLTQGPWRDPQIHYPQTSVFPVTATFQQLGNTRLTSSILVAIIILIVVNWIFNRTTWGYELRVIGNNPRAARYAGIPIASNILLVMALSGGLAGIAGMLEVSSVVHRLQEGIIPGYLFSVVTVAWLARLNVYGIIGVSFLIAGLLVGSFVMQICGIQAGVAVAIQGMILLFVIGLDFLTNYRFRVIKEGGR